MPPTPVKMLTPQVVRAAHHAFTLDNGLKCIVIEDKEAKMASTAMSIRTGQLCDPVQLPGLAHFCEHMLFMGTEKFPGEDEYGEFITKNGGHTNAWTADRSTTYYFNVSDDGLKGALERFLEFFVAPSFNSSAVSREVQAVHSEDEKNHSVDYWRVDEICRLISDPRHPRHRYGNGNITTLRDEPSAQGIDVRQQLVEFYNQNYFANGACVAVYSKYAAHDILSLISPTLERMKQGTPPSFSYTRDAESVFDPAYLGSWINVRTVRKERSVRLMWSARSPMSLWRSMPYSYASHILGHECDCSVLGVFKREGLATAMVVGPWRVDEDHEVLYVDVALTPKGLASVEHVIRIVYEAIGQMLQRGAVDEDVYAEMKAEQELGFQSEEIGNPSSHCASLSADACEKTLEECWAASAKILVDNKEAAFDYLRFLTPENCVILLKWGDMPVVPSANQTPATREKDESTHACDVAEDVAADRGSVDEECVDEGEDQAHTAEEVDAEALFATLPFFAQKMVDCVTRFHGAQYSVASVPEAVRRHWTEAMKGPTFHPGLQLPPRNPFLATDFTIHPPSATSAESNEGLNRPSERFDCLHGTLSVCKDDGLHNSFKTSLVLDILSPVCYATPRDRFFSRVMHELVKHTLTETSYFGELAALENDVTPSAGGPTLTVEGPLSSVPAFFLTLMRQLLSRDTLRATRELYDTYAEQSIRYLQGLRMKQPYEHAMERVLKCRMVMFFSFDDVLPAVEDVTYDDYLNFVSQFTCSGIVYECAVAGNMQTTAALKRDTIDALETIMKAADVPAAGSSDSSSCGFGGLSIPVADRAAIPRFRDVYLPKPYTCEAQTEDATHCVYGYYECPPFNVEDPNTAVVVDIAVGVETATVRAHLDCFAKLISSAFFNALRTQEALGYIVFARSLRHEGIAALQLGVQSAVRGADGIYLLSRTHAFLDAAQAALENVCSEANVANVTRALILQREQKPSSVGADCAELRSGSTHPLGVHHKRKVVEELRKVTAGSLKQFFMAHIANTAQSRAALVVVAHSQASWDNRPNRHHSNDSCDVAFVELPPKLNQTTEEATPVDNMSSEKKGIRVEETGASGSSDDALSMPSYADCAKQPKVILKLLASLSAAHDGCSILRSSSF